MPLLSAAHRRFLQAIVDLAYCNPFTPERIELERQALGPDFVAAPRVWSFEVDREAERANIQRLVERLEPILNPVRDQLAAGAHASEADLKLYEDAALYLLYNRYRALLHETIEQMHTGQRNGRKIDYWQRFRHDVAHYLAFPETSRTLPTRYEPAHLLAAFFQIRRAFEHTFASIIGGSMPAARLRAAVWQSIFTHDLRRYQRSLYQRMADLTTLITGPSGTGKELVARAIGQSRYIPFDPEKGEFVENFADSFFALNISALPPTLIESELFGHQRGAFTGAVADRTGWLEACPPFGTVFLDEIGELDASIQVKLLRVLQTRQFERVGDTRMHQFHGKIIAATNRNLAQEMAEGRFREDFYYRLCSDIVTTPTLAEQLRDHPADRRNLVLFIARRVAGDEAEPLADEVETWIDAHMGDDYPWPGNVRELEQCVRNVLIRQAYVPPTRSADEKRGDLAARLEAVDMTADELLAHYCTLAYAKLGSYEGAARRLGLDRRTVKRKVDPALAQGLREG